MNVCPGTGTAGKECNEASSKACEKVLSRTVGLLLLGIECDAMVGRTRKVGIGEVRSTLATSLHKPETVFALIFPG